MTSKQRVKGMSRKQRAAAMIAIRRQQTRRSPRAISMDSRRTARKTFDEDSDSLPLWQRHPGRYDVLGVDTRIDVELHDEITGEYTEYYLNGWKIPPEQFINTYVASKVGGRRPKESDLDFKLRKMNATHFAVKAHAQVVSDAVDRGETVPEEVLNKYSFTKRLARPIKTTDTAALDKNVELLKQELKSKKASPEDLEGYVVLLKDTRKELRSRKPKPKIEKKPVTELKTTEDVKKWIEEKSKEYGGRHKFLSSDEYKAEYPKLKKIHAKAQDEYNKATTKATGLNVGDRVYYDVVSPYGHVEKLNGAVVNYRGTLRVKLDQKHNDKRYVLLHKGWQESKPDSIKTITKNLPDGYEIRKWSYTDNAGKQTVHAVLFEGKPVFGQNKTFGSLTDARKAVKEHADTQRLREQIRKEREYFKKHGHLGKTGYIGTPLKKTRKTKKSSDVIGERPTGVVRKHLHNLWGQVHGDEQIGDFETWISEQSDKTYSEAKDDLLRRGARRKTELTHGEQAKQEVELARREIEMDEQSCDFHISECDRGDMDDCRIACTGCGDEDSCITARL